MRNLKKKRSNCRRGMAIVFTLVVMVVMLGFCSLAVDFAHVETTKTELRRAADAAARDAAANLSNGTSSARTAAKAMAANNLADNTSVVLQNSDIQFLNWTSNTSYTVVSNATNANAVKITTRRTAATNNAVTLYFAGILGMKTCDVTATATAVMITNTQTAYVSANSNPWLAGESAGTLASQPDPGYPTSDHEWKYDIAGTTGGTDPTKRYSTDYAANEPYGSPAPISITLQPGATISVTNVSGQAQNDPAQSEYNASGYISGTTSGQANYDDSASGGVSEHGIADVTMPLNSMLGVFLTNSTPDTQTAPAALDFSTSTEQNYTTIAPKLQQPFYIGDGQTTSATQQSITVPQNATRMYLGTMDGWEWSNNTGGYTATITQTYIEIVQ